MTTLESLTPILIVDAIETVLPFWVDRLGFHVVIEMSHGARLGFVVLARDGARVMYQTRASLADDLPELGDLRSQPGCVIYVRIDDLDSIHEHLDETTIEVGPRTTFYGAREIFVRDPAGHVIGFAEFGGEPETQG